MAEEPPLGPLQAGALDRAVASGSSSRRSLGFAGALQDDGPESSPPLVAVAAGVVAAHEPVPIEPRARGAALGVAARGWSVARAASLAGVPEASVRAGLAELEA